MDRMGATCSGRQRAQWREEEYQERRMASNISNTMVPSQRRSLRHSVVSAIQDGSVAKLYPVQDNYVNEDDGRRSPKSLSALCVDAVCRSLPNLNGELPAGLPQDVVDGIVDSLVKHAALTATTLRVLKNCELGKLVLCGCRGVTDEWLEPFMTQNAIPSVGLPFHENMDLEYSTNDSHQEYAYGVFGHPENLHLGHEEGVAESCNSSRSTSSSFCTAKSNLDQDTENATHHHEAASFHATTTAEAAGDPFREDYMMEEEDRRSLIGYDASVSVAAFSSPTASLTELDLRGSQRLTDRGLLQLQDLCQLEVARLDNCHGICGRGLLALTMSHSLHTLSLSGCRRLTDEAIINVSNVETLQSLNLEGCRCLTDRSLAALSGLFCLQKLDLSQCDLVTDAGLEHLEGLQHLEELSLGWCRSISDHGLDILTAQPRRSEVLRVLRLARCTITDGGIGHLGRLLALEELDLNGCSNVSSVSLGNVLEKMVNLQQLDVSYCPGILRSSWQGKIQTLRSIDVCYSRVNDGDVARLTSLPSLETINLGACTTLGDWAIAHLADNNVVPNLKSLDLADTELTDLGMVHLPKFQKLTRLSLFYCNVTNVGLRHISELKELEELNLDSRDISDSGLVHLRKLQKLRCLDLFSGRITDSGAGSIAQIKSLESLELCGGSIGDLGCTLLSSLGNLTSLNLSQNERITNRGASAFAALKFLKALNLSNTRVDASGDLRLPKSLQSLALYGCRGIEDGNGMSLLQTDLPSLKCLRLNQQSNEDGVMIEEEDDSVEHDGERSIREALRLSRQAAFENGGDDSENSIMEEEEAVADEDEDPFYTNND